MAIPALNDTGELPPGEYVVTLDEIEARFGSANRRRRTLMGGLKRAAIRIKSLPTISMVFGKPTEKSTCPY